MMGSFLTRGLVMAFGYAYPAYECFKTVEKNKPEIEQLRFWCQYWILVAVLTVSERVGDTFISWVPLYCEAKLAFFIYLWYPKTKGTTYVYDSLFRPYLAKHETEIDRNLLELKARASDVVVLYWQKAASYGPTRVFEILQYVASQSTSRPRPAQQDGGARQPPAAIPTHQPAVTTTQQQQPKKLPLRTGSTPSTQQQDEPSQEADPPLASPAALLAQTTSADQPTAKATSHSQASESEAMQTDPVPSLANGITNLSQQEMFTEEAIWVTRGRSRKNRAAANR
ncbi:hypothetical protein HHK36_002992 [Tetracentron sinense]|uniref:HVA22-like protein n=1 Tax=Tetracentron sinense TaxID=13715 RepID=A0A835DNH8_TETSI|nr:hypothetical protein HHK36_002992 [Tetracentron sinense]